MTDREKRFVDEFMVDLSAKQAAIRAGYSVKTARNAAAWIHPEHPEKPRLREEIDRRMAEAGRRTGVSADRIIRELALVAFSNIGDLVDPDTGRMLHDASRADMAAASGIRVKRGDKGDEYEVRTHDKLKALELLGRHFALFADKGQSDESNKKINDIIEAVRNVE